MALGKAVLEGQFGGGGWVEFDMVEGFGVAAGQIQESNARFKERLISLSIPPSLPPSLSQLRPVWLTAGPHCIRLNHKLPTHLHICKAPPRYLTLASPVLSLSRSGATFIQLYSIPRVFPLLLRYYFTKALIIILFLRPPSSFLCTLQYKCLPVRVCLDSRPCGWTLAGVFFYYLFFSPFAHIVCLWEGCCIVFLRFQTITLPNVTSVFSTLA